MFLVDTNVVSVGSPPHGDRSPELRAWLRENGARLYVSVVTVTEITFGIANLRRRGAMRKADALAAWLDALLADYSDRVLSFDVASARVAGLMTDQARGRGLTAGFADIAIAATARARGCTVLTRNVRHFDGIGVRVHDPFDTLPESG